MTDLVNGNDMVVLNDGGLAGLMLEAGVFPSADGEFRLQDLDRHQPVQLIVRLIDDTEAALTQHAPNMVGLQLAQGSFVSRRPREMDRPLSIFLPRTCYLFR